MNRKLWYVENRPNMFNLNSWEKRNWGNDKEEKAQASAAENLAATQKAQGELAKSQITAAGAPTTEETARLAKYTSDTNKPAEQLLTDAGPISQAIASRVLERAQTPGMDFDSQSKDFETKIGTPVWRALKSRGIVAPPGSEGGGLGTQQYMKNVIPEMAQARSNQINTDITRGQGYTTDALNQKNNLLSILETLSNSVRNRQLTSVTNAADYGYKGNVGGADTSYGESQLQTQRALAEQKALYDAIGKIVSGVATGGVSGLVGGIGSTLAGAADVSPYSLQLGKVATGQGNKVADSYAAMRGY